MPTRRVTATIPRYAGTGAVVIFKLSKVSAQLGPNQILLTNEVKAPIDSQGRVCGALGVELWCNVGGALPATWTVKFPDGSKQAFNLPAGDTPIDLAELLAAEPITWTPALLPLIDGRIAAAASGVPDFEADFPALTEWVVNHNLGRRPISILTTPGGVEMETEIVHLTANQSIAYFATPTAGHIRCV